MKKSQTFKMKFHIANIKLTSWTAFEVNITSWIQSLQRWLIDVALFLESEYSAGFEAFYIRMFIFKITAASVHSNEQAVND